MVRFYSKTHEYPESTPTALLAFFLRYPNPFARHVLSVDVIARRIDPSTGKLFTTRLILKRGILPRWAAQWLPGATVGGGRGLDAWVLEESVVDPGWCQIRSPENPHADQPRLQSRQGNLSFKKFMHIVEGGDIVPGPHGNALHHTTAEVRSDLGGSWSTLIRERIEQYGVGKFEGNTEMARKGMAMILDALRSRQLLPEALDPQADHNPTFARQGSDGDSTKKRGIIARTFQKWKRTSSSTQNNSAPNEDDISPRDSS